MLWRRHMTESKGSYLDRLTLLGNRCSDAAGKAIEDAAIDGAEPLSIETDTRNITEIESLYRRVKRMKTLPVDAHTWIHAAITYVAPLLTLLGKLFPQLARLLAA